MASGLRRGTHVRTRRTRPPSAHRRGSAGSAEDRLSPRRWRRRAGRAAAVGRPRSRRALDCGPSAWSLAARAAGVGRSHEHRRAGGVRCRGRAVRTDPPAAEPPPDRSPGAAGALARGCPDAPARRRTVSFRGTGSCRRDSSHGRRAERGDPRRPPLRERAERRAPPMVGHRSQGLRRGSRVRARPDAVESLAGARRRPWRGDPRALLRAGRRVEPR